MTSGLIDVHAHHLPDFYVQQATAAGHDHPDGMAAWPAWSVRDHLDLMDRSGIETAMLSLSSPGVHFGDDKAARLLARRVNTYTAEVARDHPGRFGSFASLPLPDVDGALEGIAFALDELGADGVALLTHTHGVYLGDARLVPVFAELDRRGAVVFLHPTSPVCWEQSALGRPRPMVEYIFDTARTVTDLVMAGVLTRHPDLRIIVPHCGGAIPVLADRINEFMQLFVPAQETPPRDAVQQLRTLYYDIAGTAFPRQAPALLQLADPQRILFGSDYCWTPAPLAETHIAAIDAAEPPAEGVTWRSLTTANAQRLFPRAAARRTTWRKNPTPS
ncbi:amidohydrolase family protein [Streptomyces asoensis]|uniref:amidohydrolase family protein n=1 Tax=Streptomyces asoensis TaxID=249586 RepID=UPI00368BCCCF